MALNKKNTLFSGLMISLCSFILLLLITELFFSMNNKYGFIKKTDNRQFIRNPIPDSIANKYKDVWKNTIQLVKPEKNDQLENSQKYEQNKIKIYKKSLLNHYQPHSKVQSIVKLKPSGKTIYKTSYTIDNVGRRKVNNRKRTAEKALLFLGGSNTWGDGVGDEEVLPYLVQEQLINHEVYIAAKPGFGAGEILYSVANDSFMFKDIKQKNGTAIFFFIDDHPNRSLPSLQALKSPYLLKKPMFIKENNQLVFTNYFKDHYRFQIYRTLAKSNAIKYLGFNLPINHSEKATDLFIDTLLEIEKKLKKKFNIDKLLLVSIQTGPTNGLGYSVKKKWENIGRTFYDISEYDFKKITNNQHKYPVDRHKTAPVHWLRSELIKPILKENGIN